MSTRSDVIDVLARWPFSLGHKGKKEMLEWAAVAERLSTLEHRVLLIKLKNNLRVFL